MYRDYILCLPISMVVVIISFGNDCYWLNLVHFFQFHRGFMARVQTQKEKNRQPLLVRYLETHTVIHCV